MPFSSRLRFQEGDMKPIEVTRVIERPLEEVFRFAGDSENNPTWLGVFEKVQKTSEGPLGVGTTFTDVARLMGRRFETQSEVTDYVPNRLYARRVTTGPFPAAVRIEFELVDQGTRVRLISTAEARGFLKLAEPLLRMQTERQLKDARSQADALRAPGRA
jgi:uncharacterized protein YndB with AHSA1/START domain